MYKYIEPEVSGGLGKKTQLDNSVHPPIVNKLNFEFDGWLGDDILESFPCFIVTESLKKKIEEKKLSGITFDDVIVSKSATFQSLYPSKELPKFYWAKIIGGYKKDDFFIGADFRLIISEMAYDLIKLSKSENATFEDFE